MTTFDTNERAAAPAIGDDRIAAFQEQLRLMRVPGSRPGRDRLVFALGLVLMGVAIVLAVAAYSIAHGTTDSLEQGDATNLGLIAVVVAIVGLAAFVKVVIERVLRFWIARLTFEHTTQTERLLAQGEQLLQALTERIGPAK